MSLRFRDAFFRRYDIDPIDRCIGRSCDSGTQFLEFSRTGKSLWRKLIRNDSRLPIVLATTVPIHRTMLDGTVSANHDRAALKFPAVSFLHLGEQGIA
ncbi:hypothetical protein Pan258_31570 [Symmachiella dynata]|nr:hypothetical protein Pan258_31570 [Symmachiella dynata]